MSECASYSGGTLKIHGKLKLAEGATLDCEDLTALAHGDYALVETTDGIEGQPAFSGTRGWHLEKKTVDGKETLALSWHLGTTVILR